MLNQKIKFFLKNSMSVEGIVLEYTDDYIVLISKGSKDQVVIQNPKENIIMYIIFDNTLQEEIPLEFDLEIPEEIHSLPEELKLQALAELRLQQQQMHEEHLRQKMTTFQTPNIDDIQNRYGYPTQLNTFNNSPQETRVRKENNFRKLRKMQGS